MTESTSASVAHPVAPASAWHRARRVLTGVLLLVLLVGSWRAYDWFVGNVAQRQAIAEGRLPNPEAPPPVDASDSAETGPPMSGVAPAPAAPAVRGDAIRRCVQGDREVFTNQACPEGFAADSADPPAGALNPVAVVASTALHEASASAEQRAALCHYLLAEVQRLDFEFKQPLPPPVLDRVSTRLGVLRDQGEQLQCALPKPDVRAASDTESTRPPKGR